MTWQNLMEDFFSYRPQRDKYTHIKTWRCERVNLFFSSDPSGKYKHIKIRLVCHIPLLKIFLYDRSRAKWDPYTEYQGTDRIGPNPVRPGFKTLLAKNQFC